MVFSVPMRNWNNQRISGAPRFQRTYEELKPAVFILVVISIRVSAYLWGIETVSYHGMPFGLRKFSAYLWGIETAGMNLCVYPRRSFQRTYEELKPVQPVRSTGSLRFSAYLWGIETQTKNQYIHYLKIVFSVPMRNWNNHLHRKFLRPLRFSAYLWGIETSLRFPFAPQLPRFSAYLWGIETWNESNSLWRFFLSFQRTYEELKLKLWGYCPQPVPVFSVPMRNWNSLHAPF